VALKITLGLVVAILIIGVGLGFYYSIPHNAPTPSSMSQPTTIHNVIIGTTTVAVEVADTEASREQGLSDRAGLAQNSGMLFVFDTPGNPGFWMKDMEFSLDMLFIDTNGTIVTLDQNLSPDSYHQNPPQVFYPASAIQYVLEVPAGFAAAHGIVQGQTVTFN
jgi:uncharacterized membrane protein (UPF0127 family)